MLSRKVSRIVGCHIKSHNSLCELKKIVLIIRFSPRFEEKYIDSKAIIVDSVTNELFVKLF